MKNKILSDYCSFCERQVNCYHVVERDAECPWLNEDKFLCTVCYDLGIDGYDFKTSEGSIKSTIARSTALILEFISLHGLGARLKDKE